MRYPDLIRYGLLLMLPVFFATTLWAGSLEDDILKYTNQYRQAQGKPALRSNAAVQEQAAAHSRNMSKGKVPFGHNGFNSRTKAVAKETGHVSAAAENVAYGHLDAKAVVQGWINSKTHRKNLLGNYTLIGIGTARSRDGTIYYTQLFIKP